MPKKRFLGDCAINWSECVKCIPKTICRMTLDLKRWRNLTFYLRFATRVPISLMDGECCNYLLKAVISTQMMDTKPVTQT